METYETIDTAFGDVPLSRSVTFEWFTRLKDGQPKTVHVPEDRRRPETTMLWRSNVKTILIVFLILKVSVDRKFVPRGRTVNQIFYKNVLTIRLRERIRKKRPEKWRRETWFLHSDNAPDTFSAVSSRTFD